MRFQELILPIIENCKISSARGNKKALIKMADSLRKEIRRIYDSVSEDESELWRGLCDHRVKLYQEHLKKVKLELQKLEIGFSEQDKEFTQLVEYAKSVSISSVIQESIRGNRLNCPFCNDTTGAMNIARNNTVFCYRCNDGWDTIGYVMQLRDLNFAEAVKYICAVA